MRIVTHSHNGIPPSSSNAACSSARCTGDGSTTAASVSGPRSSVESTGRGAAGGAYFGRTVDAGVGAASGVGVGGADVGTGVGGTGVATAISGGGAVGEGADGATVGAPVDPGAAVGSNCTSVASPIAAFQDAPKPVGLAGGSLAKTLSGAKSREATASSRTRRMPQRVCLGIPIRVDEAGPIWRPVAGAGMNR